MKLLTPKSDIAAASETAAETLLLSPAQIEFLGRAARDINPRMPMAFALPHVVRMLLERAEESGIDLTTASNEDEITSLAAGNLRRQSNNRRF